MLKSFQVSEGKVRPAGPVILFVSISGYLGGPGRSLATLLAALPDDARRVVACPEDGDLLAWLHKGGVVDEHLPLVRSYGHIRGKEMARLVDAYRILRWARANRRCLRAIHANGFTEMHLSVLAALATRGRLVVWFHGYADGRWDRLLAPIWRLLLRHRRPAFAAVSDVARQVACETGLAERPEVAIIPNPVSPSEVGDRPTSSAGSFPVTVGYLGTDIADKGFHHLPDIIGQVGDRPVRWLLFLSPPLAGTAGDNATWAALRGLHEASTARLAFAGRYADVSRAYRQCDMVLCPSLRESFSRITAEAMANGLPVVASDIEALRDLLGDEEAGLLFPVGESSAAAAAICRLVDDPGLRLSLGSMGRMRASRFSPPVIAGRFWKLYGASLGESGARG